MKAKQNSSLASVLKYLGCSALFLVANCGEGDRSSSLVQNAMASLLALGIEPKLMPSSTDANIPISMGIPAVTISRGGISQNSHAPNESWRDVDSHIAIQAALLIALLEAEYSSEQ